MGNFHKILLQWKGRLAIGYRLWFHFCLKEGELLKVHLPEIRCFCLNQGKMGDWYFLLLFHCIFKWPQIVLIHIELFFTFPKISPKAEIYSIKALIYLYKRKKGHFEKFFFRGWERRWEGEEKQHQTWGRAERMFWVSVSCGLDAFFHYLIF